MKPWIMLAPLVLLSACSAPTAPTAPQQEVQLEPPKMPRAGYIQLVKDANYYVDSSSIWVDNEDAKQVHFDAVINLDKGMFVYPEPKRYARSVRQYKILNCGNYRLTQVRTDFYDDFWGEGLRAAPKKQEKYTIHLQPNSSLYTLGQIICVNADRTPSDRNRKM